jgi:hypothetical protein
MSDRKRIELLICSTYIADRLLGVFVAAPIEFKKGGARHHDGYAKIAALLTKAMQGVGQHTVSK